MTDLSPGEVHTGVRAHSRGSRACGASHAQAVAPSTHSWPSTVNVVAVGDRLNLKLRPT